MMDMISWEFLKDEIRVTADAARVKDKFFVRKRDGRIRSFPIADIELVLVDIKIRDEAIDFLNEAPLSISK